MTVAGGPLHDKVLSAQSADETTSAAVFVAGYSQLGTMVVTSAGVSAGSVTLEAAPTSDFAGAWLTLGTAVSTVAASTVYRSTAVNSAVGYVRARIDTVITGGTVDVWIMGN